MMRVSHIMALSGRNDFVRIKKGVKPYGGRVVELVKDCGKTVILDVGRASRPQYEGSVSDERVYNKAEVEPYVNFKRGFRK